MALWREHRVGDEPRRVSQSPAVRKIQNDDRPVEWVNATVSVGIDVHHGKRRNSGAQVTARPEIASVYLCCGG